MPHLNGEVLTIKRLHLMQSIPLELLGLDPHCHLQHPSWEKETVGYIESQREKKTTNKNNNHNLRWEIGDSSLLLRSTVSSSPLTSCVTVEVQVK